MLKTYEYDLLGVLSAQAYRETERLRVLVCLRMAVCMWACLCACMYIYICIPVSVCFSCTLI